MNLRTLVLPAFLLLLTGAASAQATDRAERTPAHYAEADLQRLTELLGLRPEQVEECRRMMEAYEKTLFDRRELLRKELEVLDRERHKHLVELARKLDEKQVELLNGMLKTDRLPITMDTAEPGTVRARVEEPAKGREKQGPVKQTSPTTLSR